MGQALELAAFRAALRSLKQLPADIYLAINVSPDLVLGGRLASILEDVAEGRVVLEITEHAIISDIDRFQRALEPLRAKARIALDDAGAGYSGLRHVLDIEPDIIKLDMSLTRNIDRDRARHALAAALIAFCHEMGCQIVAEGVETAEELETLRELGTHFAQGYYLHRPKPLAALSRSLVSRGLGCTQSG